MSDVDKLIENLAADHKPVKKMAHPLLRVLPWFFVAATYIGAVVFYLGIRPDVADKLQDVYFLMDIGLMFFIALSSALCSAWLCVPDMRGHKWMIGVPFTMVFVFGLWTTVLAMTKGMGMPNLAWDHCYEDGMFMAVIPATLLIFLTQQGATTRPYLTAFMNILSISALGYIGLRFTCIMDSIEHAFLMHILPFVIFGTILGFFARRVYNW